MRLMDWLLVDLPSEAKTPREMARFAADRIREAGFSGERVILGLGADRAYLRRLEFPCSSRRKIERDLPREMEATLPMNKEDLVFDARVLDKAPDKGCRVHAAAVPRTVVEQWMRSLRDFGYEPDRIDLMPSALSELGLPGDVGMVDACTVVWELGRSKSAVAFLRRGRLESTDGFWIGTEDFARILANRTGRSREEARKDIERGMPFPGGSGAEKDASYAQDEVLGACAKVAHKELMRSIQGFQQEAPDVEVGKVVLTGRGARWQELASAVAALARVRLSVVQDVPLAFDASRMQDDEIPEVASAACLPLLELKKGRRGWNFSKSDLASRRKRSWRRLARDIGLGFGVVLLGAAISLSLPAWLNKQGPRHMRHRTEVTLRNTATDASPMSLVNSLARHQNRDWVSS
jgi:Tfp pilus assembly PilM family ATPase